MREPCQWPGGSQPMATVLLIFIKEPKGSGQSWYIPFTLKAGRTVCRVE